MPHAHILMSFAEGHQLDTPEKAAQILTNFSGGQSGLGSAAETACEG